MDRRLLWGKFLNIKTAADVDEIRGLDETIDKAIDRLIEISADPKVREAYETRQKQLEQYEKIQELLSQGIEVTEVANKLNTSVEEIENLLESI